MVSNRFKFWRVRRGVVQLIKTSTFGTALRHCLHASVDFENAPSLSVQYEYCELRSVFNKRSTNAGFIKLSGPLQMSAH